MCVILVSTETLRPTESQIAKAFRRNGDGAGMAWLEPAEDGDGMEVVWKKGIEDLNELQELVATVPLPFITHCRIASIGKVCPELTHPFEISEWADNALEGRSKKGVLFHNGTWHKWDDMLLTSAVRFAMPIPRGRWNDTRALAFLGHLYGPGLYELMPDQKIAIITPEYGVEVFHPDKWKAIDGILASNDAWVHEYAGNFKQSHSHQGPVGGGQQTPSTTYSSSRDVERKPCDFGNCKNQAIYGRDFCTEHISLDKNVVTGQMTHLTPKGDTQSPGPNERSPFEIRCHKMVGRAPEMVFNVAKRVHESMDGRLSKNAWKRVQKAVEEELQRRKQEPREKSTTILLH